MSARRMSCRMVCRAVGRGLVAAAALAGALALSACDRDQPVTYQGWVEADILFVGPDEAGRVEVLSVREGDTVEQGAPLFTVDADLQRADLAEREAMLANAQQAYDRAKALLRTQAGTQRALDDAEAALRTAQARLKSSQTKLARRKVFSPAAGTVQQIYFRTGEMVAAGRAVLALLPPGNIKARFYVKEAVLPQVKLGDTVTVRCDGCASDITATVSFIARASEFTPPVIYSREESAKLVFLVEARPTRPEQLRVGQPLSVSLATPPAPAGAPR
jgi:HlyD family secretion protein